MSTADNSQTEDDPQPLPGQTTIYDFLKEGAAPCSA